MARDRVEFLELPTLTLAPSALAPGEVGSRSVQVSVEPESGAETRLVQFAPYWYWQPSEPRSNDIEILVLDGALTINDWEMKRGGYLYLPAAAPLETMSSPKLCRVLWMVNSREDVVSEQGPEYIADICAMPWVKVPDFKGRAASETGGKVYYKMLHEDPVTTAYTLLSYKTAGWSEPRLEAHETWEELVLLDGDTLMGVAGQVLGGTYIFRTGEEPHGPQATRYGSVWFARGNKRIDFDFSESAVAKRQVERYLAPDKSLEATNLRPWGSWSQLRDQDG